jgi:hypothetical protein
MTEVLLWRRLITANWGSQATGIKVAKINVLVILLSIPVVNVITGAALVAHVITSFSQLVQSRP